MPLLGLLWGASGITSLGRYLIIGAAIVGVSGYVVNNITAPYKRELAAAKFQNLRLVKASADKDAQIEADRTRYEEDRKSQEQFDAEIQKVLRGRTSACTLSAAELRDLEKLAKR